MSGYINTGFGGIWICMAGFLVLLPLPPTGSTELYVTDERSFTWTKANNSCTLAKPEITYFRDRERLDISTSLLGDDEPWVGLYQAVTTFEYIGCWKRSDLINYAVKEIVTRTNVGTCYSACRTRRFAINKFGLCLCLTEFEKITADILWGKCDKDCDGIACGGKNINHMSVYLLVTIQPPSTKSPRCLTVNSNNATLWRRCTYSGNEIDGIICPYQYGENPTYEVKYLREAWFKSVKECPDGSTGSLAENDRLADLDNEMEYYWTTFVAILTIYKDVPLNTVPVNFGYAERDGSYLKLAFRTDPDDDSVSSAICEAETTTTSTTTDTPSMTTSTVSSTASSTTSSTVSSISSSTASSTASMLDRHTNNVEETRSCGLYIGLGIGLTLLVVAVAAVIVFVILRWKRRKPSPERPDSSFANMSYNTGPPAPSVNAATNQTQSSLPTYAILEPTNVSKQRAPATIATTPENVYDVSGTPVSDTRKDSNDYFNVYNTAGKPELEDVYDHTEGGTFAAKKAPIEAPGNWYDVNDSRINNHNIQSDNVYNVADDVQAGENIYNHTNDNQADIAKHGKRLPTNDARKANERNDYDHVAYKE